MAWPQQGLTRDLYTYLLNEFYSVPAPRRRRSAWVMNQEWLNECRKILDYGPTLPEMLTPPEAEIMLGRPVYVTEDGGFPHLIAD